jgi:hypothetical protein
MCPRHAKGSDRSSTDPANSSATAYEHSVRRGYDTSRSCGSGSCLRSLTSALSFGDVAKANGGNDVTGDYYAAET